MTNDNIKLHRWRCSDWKDFKIMRLEALKTNASVFLKNYNVEAAQPDSYWQDCLTGENNAVFGLYDGDDVIGLTGAFRSLESPSDTVDFGMSFIRPSYRGRGLSALFYEARIAWAREQPGITKIHVSHRDGNDASRNANQRFGFVATHVAEMTYGDGTTTRNHHYILML